MAAISNKIVILVMSMLATAWSLRDDDRNDQQKQQQDIRYTVTQEVWFDVTIKDHEGPGEDYNGRFVIGLFGKIAPMCSMNFAALAKGYSRPGGKGRKASKKLTYKNSPVHRIVPDFIIQMGDIIVGDGTGGESIFGTTFVDENFDLSHKAGGYVSMANHGIDTNASQFFIILNKARWLDNKHVVFGKVVRGMDVVDAIGDVPTNTETAIPFKGIKITDCGVFELEKSYDLTSEQASSREDI